MFGSSKVFVGLDVGTWSVKAVALQNNKGRLSLVGYSHMRVEDQDPSLITRHVLDHMGLKPRNVVSAVSGRSVIVRQVETPKLGDAELRGHIAKETDKYIPFDVNEVELDCHILPPAPREANSPNQQVLLVAVRRGFVEDHISMLQAAGITPQVIDVDVFALCNAYWTLGPQRAVAPEPADEDDDRPPEQPDEETVALVDIGATKSWVAIVKGERPLFQREIYLAGNEITDSIVRAFNEQADEIENIKLNPDTDETLEALVDAAMPAFEDLANEIRLSFDYVEGQFDEEVGRVVLSGGSALLPTMPDVLGNILGRPVQVFDPCGGLDLTPSKYDLHSLDANAPALTVALGLACHLAADDAITGLGGSQHTSWVPRRGGLATGASASGAVAAAGVDSDPEETLPTMEAPASAAPPPPSQEAFAFPSPLPEQAPPPPSYEPEPGGPPPAPAIGTMPELAPPPDASAAAPTMAAPPPEAQSQQPIDIPPPTAPASDTYEKDANRSSMLVILDDESHDDMIVGGEGADEDDDALPPLPT